MRALAIIVLAALAIAAYSAFFVWLATIPGSRCPDGMYAYGKGAGFRCLPNTRV